MKWFKSFQRQGTECRETENRFMILVPPMFSEDKPIGVNVCVLFKTYCHSGACFEMRQEKGQE